MTEQLYRSDAYMQTCDARVVAVNERGGIVLDRTNFYASAGGQPGDIGTLIIDGGAPIAIATTVYDTDKKSIVHVPAAPLAAPPAAGAPARLTLEWSNRHKLMRMHTGLHLLCSLVRFPVTGGQIGAEEGRLDFDITDSAAVDKDALTAQLQALIDADHAVGERWITDAELDANPGLVRTMTVKPPMGSGKVRLVLIGANGAIDMQPCGGTHVRATGEIGRLSVTKIEKKGKQNRRIRVAFVTAIQISAPSAK